MEVSFIRIFPLCRRALPAARHSLSVSVLRSPPSFSPVMASVHIIVDSGRNGNRENAEYAVWQ